MKSKITTRLTALEVQAEREARRQARPIILVHDGRKLLSDGVTPWPDPPFTSPYPVMHVRFRSKAGIVEGRKLVRRDAVKKQRKNKQQKRRNSK